MSSPRKARLLHYGLPPMLMPDPENPTRSQIETTFPPVPRAEKLRLELERAGKVLTDLEAENEELADQVDSLRGRCSHQSPPSQHRAGKSASASSPRSSEALSPAARTRSTDRKSKAKAKEPPEYYEYDTRWRPLFAPPPNDLAAKLDKLEAQLGERSRSQSRPQSQHKPELSAVPDASREASASTPPSQPPPPPPLWPTSPRISMPRPSHRLVPPTDAAADTDSFPETSGSLLEAFEEHFTMAASCIFCKIVKSEIPSFKLFESDKVFAFLDINPLSRGHALVIPKFHGTKLTDIPDDQLSEILPVVKSLVRASGAENYNVLQNNGKIAHQQVDHVHFHMIPKPNQEEGLGVSWPQQKTDMDKLKALFEEIKAKM